MDIIVHSNFDPFKKDNDIGIINLKTTLEFTSEFYPIELPVSEHDLPKKLTFLEWSHGHVGKLKRQHVPVWNPKMCFKLFKKFFSLSNRRFCAGRKSKFFW